MLQATCKQKESSFEDLSKLKPVSLKTKLNVSGKDEYQIVEIELKNPSSTIAFFVQLQYLDENGNEVSKESLSAGEKQLMIIAILWALALCSKKKLPVIIDTPLSRLDSQHRTSIISTYFPNASDQTIILSTDTEIDQNYYEMMKNSVGDEFTLVYSEETKSTSIKKGYFQEL